MASTAFQVAAPWLGLICKRTFAQLILGLVRLVTDVRCQRAACMLAIGISRCPRERQRDQHQQKDGQPFAHWPNCSGQEFTYCQRHRPWFLKVGPPLRQSLVNANQLLFN